jgi:hypothetical protein
MNWWRRIWDRVYKSRLREVDRTVLWPTLLEQAGGNIDVARRAFRHHARSDTAYSYLSPSELDRYINELPPE